MDGYYYYHKCGVILSKMSGCVAYGCSNRSTKGFLMKVFPRDPVIRAIWAEQVNREGWTPTNYSRLCETHFESDQWEKTRVDGSRKLKWNAVPTLFAHVKINKQKRKSPTKLRSPIKKRKLLRTWHTSVPDQRRMECEDTESLPSTGHQSSHISSSLQVCKSYHCQKYGNPEPGTELQNIKEEPDYEIATNMETQSLIPSGELKHEPDYESHNMQKEANGREESDTSIMKRSSTGSPALSSLDTSFLYCEKCQLKYEGGCHEHGPVIYLDNAEEDQGQGYSQDSSPQVQVVDNKDRQVLGREKVEQSKVCEAHSDDVGTLPNGGCRTESDEMFSVCETNTELCVAGTSCGLQSCDVCGVGFIESRGLITHMRTHTVEKPYKCGVCGTGFTEQDHLKKHKRTHTGEKPYKCDVCGLGYSRQGYLKIHKRSHTGVKPYLCDVCGTGFSWKSSLKIHQSTHTGEKPYKCDVCGLRFTRQDNLKKHNRTHTGEQPYQCDVCGTGFFQQGNLKIHKRIHTGDKPYKCDLCGLGFPHSGSLISHKRRHTGEKPYKCDVCGTGFSQQGHLKIHKRIHTGDKPYTCDLCGSGFTQLCDRNRHLRTHTGEKPYKCDVCGTRFTFQSSLKRHMRTHTGEKPTNAIKGGRASKKSNLNSRGCNEVDGIT